MAKSRRRRQELRVIFDTNVIFTGSTSDLLRHEVASFVEKNTTHADLDVHCYLPEIVVHERQFQMLTRAVELLPAIEKLERLLGHKLAITPEIINGRVKVTVTEQINRLGLRVQQLNTSSVDWKRLIEDSAYRNPPFETGEKEKGFRDSIIMETFQQLVDESPTTPRVCRIVLLTGDNLLRDVATERMSERKNVQVMESLEDLKGLINTLVGEVDEDFVAKVRVKAIPYFFDKNNETSLMLKEGLQAKIRERFSEELAVLPPGANTQQGGKWYISAPSFVKKEGQRIYWSTRINIMAEALKRELKGVVEPSESSPYPIARPISRNSPQVRRFLRGAGFSPGFEYQSGDTSPPTIMGTEQPIAKGKTIIEVGWSVSVSTSERFSNPKIESLNFIETVWD